MSIVTKSIRDRFIASMKNLAGKKETFTRKLKDLDVSISLAMLPSSSADADVEEMARRVGVKGVAKDEDGVIVDSFQKTYLPGENAAGLVRAINALGHGLETEGERAEREACETEAARQLAEAKALAEKEAATLAEKEAATAKRKSKKEDATA